MCWKSFNNQGTISYVSKNEFQQTINDLAVGDGLFRKDLDGVDFTPTNGLVVPLASPDMAVRVHDLLGVLQGARLGSPKLTTGFVKLAGRVRELPVDPPDATYGRIDVVYAAPLKKRNEREEYEFVSCTEGFTLGVKKGTPAAQPVAPALNNAEAEFCLAYIYVPVGTTSITEALITDCRKWVIPSYEQFDALLQLIQDNAEDIATLRSDFETFRVQVTNEFVAVNNAINILITVDQSLQAQIDQLQIDVQNIFVNIASLQSDIATILFRLSSSGDIGGGIAANLAAINQLQIDLAQLRADAEGSDAQLQAQIDNILALLATYQTTLQNLQTQITDNANTIAQNFTNLSALITALDQRVTVLEATPSVWTQQEKDIALADINRNKVDIVGLESAINCEYSSYEGMIAHIISGDYEAPSISGYPEAITLPIETPGSGGGGGGSAGSEVFPEFNYSHADVALMSVSGPTSTLQALIGGTSPMGSGIERAIMGIPWIYGMDDINFYSGDFVALQDACDFESPGTTWPYSGGAVVPDGQGGNYLQFVAPILVITSVQEQPVVGGLADDFSFEATFELPDWQDQPVGPFGSPDAWTMNLSFLTMVTGLMDATQVELSLQSDGSGNVTATQLTYNAVGGSGLTVIGTNLGTWQAYNPGGGPATGARIKLKVYKNGTNLNIKFLDASLGGVATPDIYYPSSSVVFQVPDASVLDTLRAYFLEVETDLPSGTSIDFDLSFDGGSTWPIIGASTGNLENLIPKKEVSGTDLHIRVNLATTDTEITPTLKRFAFHGYANGCLRMLKEMVDANTADIADLFNQFTSYQNTTDAAISALNQDIATLTSTDQGLQNQINSIQSDLWGVINDLNNLTFNVDNNTFDIAFLQSELQPGGSVYTMIVNNSTAITQLQADLAQLRLDAEGVDAALQAQIDSLTTVVNNAITAISNLETLVTTNTQDIANNFTALTALNADFLNHINNHPQGGIWQQTEKDAILAEQITQNSRLDSLEAASGGSFMQSSELYLNDLLHVESGDFDAFPGQGPRAFGLHGTPAGALFEEDCEAVLDPVKWAGLMNNAQAVNGELTAINPASAFAVWAGQDAFATGDKKYKFRIKTPEGSGLVLRAGNYNSDITNQNVTLWFNPLGETNNNDKYGLSFSVAPYGNGSRLIFNGNGPGNVYNNGSTTIPQAPSIIYPGFSDMDVIEHIDVEIVLTGNQIDFWVSMNDLPMVLAGSAMWDPAKQAVTGKYLNAADAFNSIGIGTTLVSNVAFDNILVEAVGVAGLVYPTAPEAIVFNPNDDDVVPNLASFRVEADIVHGSVPDGTGETVIRTEDFSDLPLLNFAFEPVASPYVSHGAVDLGDQVEISWSNDVSLGVFWSSFTPVPFGIWSDDISQPNTRIELDYWTTYLGAYTGTGFCLVDASGNVVSEVLAACMWSNNTPMLAQAVPGASMSYNDSPYHTQGSGGYWERFLKWDIIIHSATTYQVLLWDSARSMILIDSGIMTASGNIAKLAICGGASGSNRTGEIRMDRMEIVGDSNLSSIVTDVAFDLSFDGGSTWPYTGLALGQEIVVGEQGNDPEDVRIKARIQTTDSSVSPIVRSFNLTTTTADLSGNVTDQELQNLETRVGNLELAVGQTISGSPVSHVLQESDLDQNESAYSMIFGEFALPLSSGLSAAFEDDFETGGVIDPAKWPLSTFFVQEDVGGNKKGRLGDPSVWSNGNAYARTSLFSLSSGYFEFKMREEDTNWANGDSSLLLHVRGNSYVISEYIKRNPNLNGDWTEFEVNFVPVTVPAAAGKQEVTVRYEWEISGGNISLEVLIEGQSVYSKSSATSLTEVICMFLYSWAAYGAATSRNTAFLYFDDVKAVPGLGSGATYETSGVLMTSVGSVVAAQGIASALVQAAETLPAGTSMSYEISLDGRNTWESVTLGNLFSVMGSAFEGGANNNFDLKVTMGTTDPNETPRLGNVLLTSTGLDAAGILGALSSHAAKTNEILDAIDASADFAAMKSAIAAIADL